MRDLAVIRCICAEILRACGMTDMEGGGADCEVAASHLPHTAKAAGRIPPWTGGKAALARPAALGVQIFHTQGITLDEIAPRLYHIAHQLGKNIIGLCQIINFHLQQGARFRV
jgi:hypothetical protein